MGSSHQNDNDNNNNDRYSSMSRMGTTKRTKIKPLADFQTKSNENDDDDDDDDDGTQVHDAASTGSDRF